MDGSRSYTSLFETSITADLARRLPAPSRPSVTPWGQTLRLILTAAVPGGNGFGFAAGPTGEQPLDDLGPDMAAPAVGRDAWPVREA
jgi:hypothetical protein